MVRLGRWEFDLRAQPPAKALPAVSSSRHPIRRVDRFPRRRLRGVTGGPRQTFAPRSLPRPATRIGSTGTRVLAVSRSSLNGVDNDERVSDRVIAFVALHKPARRRLRRPAGANAIVAVAPDLDDRRDSDVAKGLTRRTQPGGRMRSSATSAVDVERPPTMRCPCLGTRRTRTIEHVTIQRNGRLRSPTVSRLRALGRIAPPVRRRRQAAPDRPSER
jgi:hypothetical protein